LKLAFDKGWSVDKVFDATAIDPWFLENLKQIVDEGQNLDSMDLLKAKKYGFSDIQIAHQRTKAGTPTTADDVRAERLEKGIIPTYRLVDTCAAEFEAYTPYFYSSYGTENEAIENDKKKIIILGGGPNRIGQGIEFDYCCVHASYALKELGYETVMVNSNPETVSTDYDTSDKLYFEPLTLEDVLHICDQEKPDGVIVQFGGQTPLNLAADLERHGVPIVGTSPKSIELAEDRKFFSALLDKIGLKQAEAGTAVSEDEASAIAERIGFPVLVRPSFVLGGRGMMIVYSDEELRRYIRGAADVSPAKDLAKELNVKGLMNIQFAVKDEELYVIEVNPRASRTVPFVSKSIGVPLAKLAAKIMVGEKLVDLGFTEEVLPKHNCVKEAVFPWPKFPGVDIVLGPEMKSTGEVMGIDDDLGLAYAKAQISAFNPLPTEGNVFLSVNDRDKEASVPIAKELSDLGFTIYATGGTFKMLEKEGVPVDRLYKLAEQRRPNVMDMMKNREIDFVINTPSGHEAREDEIKIRSGAVANKISHCTNLAAAEASVKAIRSLKEKEFTVTPLQERI